MSAGLISPEAALLGFTGLSLCACEPLVPLRESKFPLLIRTPVELDEGNPNGLIYLLITSFLRPYLQIQSHSNVSGLRALTYELWEFTIQPITIMNRRHLSPLLFLLHPPTTEERGQKK